MTNVVFHIEMITENTHKVAKIVHEDKIIAEFNEELGKIDLSGLFLLQDRGNTGTIIRSFKDKEPEATEIHFTITKEDNSYVINAY